MSKSAKGTIENPGKNISQKRGLNRVILKQGWGLLRVLTKYKVEHKGGSYVEVNPAYTSQKCPCCGNTHKDNRKTQSMFKCVLCGFSANADLVGSVNIREAGRALLKVQGAVLQLEEAMNCESTEIKLREYQFS